MYIIFKNLSKVYNFFLNIKIYSNYSKLFKNIKIFLSEISKNNLNYPNDT